MKGAIIKQYYSMEYAWRSTPYVDFEHLLDSFVYRSQGISLANALKADVWVLDGEARIPGGHAEYFRQCGNHAALNALCGAQQTTSWDDVPWGKYDVVLGFEPIVPPSVIERYPQILWCYRSLGHCWPAHRRWSRRPDGKYDLFLDHFAGGGWRRKLPASICFPHMVDVEIMRPLATQRAPAVFLDHWMVPRVGHPDTQEFYDGVIQSYEELSGLPIYHSLGLGARTESHVDIAAGKRSRAADYLRQVARCKYFAVIREGPAIGQAVTEAAALGCIVISNSQCRYAQRVCHPHCLTPTTRRQEDKEIGMRAIRTIEADQALQEEILAYQDERLRRHFWDEPMAVLEEALEVKRGHG